MFNGLQGFYGLSPLKSYIYGRREAMIASNSSLCLYGGDEAQLAAQRVRITSTSLLDVESRKHIKVKAGGLTHVTVGKKLTVKSDDDTSFESKKKFILKTKDLLDVDGGDEAKMKAKKWSVEATDADYKMKTKGKLDVASDGWIQLKHKDSARFFANGANAMMENLKGGGSFWVGSGNATAEVKNGASVELKSASISVKGKSKLDVDASTINIKGKVMLG